MGRLHIETNRMRRRSSPELTRDYDEWTGDHDPQRVIFDDARRGVGYITKVEKCYSKLHIAIEGETWDYKPTDTGGSKWAKTTLHHSVDIPISELVEQVRSGKEVEFKLSLQVTDPITGIDVTPTNPMDVLVSSE